jgi:hypothetical protein
MENTLFLQFKNRIEVANDYPTLINIFNEMNETKLSGELDSSHWWSLYNLISPKLQRAFKNTATGTLMNDLLCKEKIQQTINSLPADTGISLTISKPKEQDFQVLESVCGKCGNELILDGYIFRCSVCGCAHFPESVSKAESEHDNFGFQPFVIASPLF